MGRPRFERRPLAHRPNPPHHVGHHRHVARFHRLAFEVGAKEQRVANEIQLDAVDVVSLADVLENPHDIVADLRVLIIRKGPPLPGIRGRILPPILLHAHDVLGVLPLLPRQRPGGERALRVVHAVAPEHLHVVLVAVIDHDGQRIGAQLLQGHQPVAHLPDVEFLVLPDELAEDFADLGLMRQNNPPPPVQ